MGYFFQITSIRVSSPRWAHKLKSLDDKDRGEKTRESKDKPKKPATKSAQVLPQQSPRPVSYQAARQPVAQPAATKQPTAQPTAQPVQPQQPQRPVSYQAARQPAVQPVQRQVAAQPATQQQQEQARFQPSERVQAYFNNLVPVIKQNSGVPGRDYNASRYKPNFWEDIDIRTNVETSDDPADVQAYNAHTGSGRNITGWAFPAYGDNKAKIRFVGTPDDETIVHELKHYQNMDADFDNPGSGRSDLDNRRLQAGYGFAGEDVAGTYLGVRPELLPQLAQDEQATTHGEYQFRVFNDLWDQLGREPTPEEFLQHVDNMPIEDLIRARSERDEAPNKYFQRAMDRHVWKYMHDPDYDRSTFPAAENFRQALKTVAQLGRRRNSMQSAPYPQQDMNA